jgi:hypothetical protein
MSHEATNWAIKQRGLKPTTKIVLWHLCDRFNPDYGCFPSQARLAHDCEISRLLRQNGQRRRLSAPEHDQRRHVRIDAGTRAGHSRAPSHAGDPVNGLVSRPRHGLSLCAGGRGLDLGVILAELGFHTRAFVEWDEWPRSVLIAAQRAGYFGQAPIWDDLRSFDAHPLAAAHAWRTLAAAHDLGPLDLATGRMGRRAWRK